MNSFIQKVERLLENDDEVENTEGCGYPKRTPKCRPTSPVPVR